MRKNILLIAILLAGVSVAKSQETIVRTSINTDAGTTAMTILNVHLHNFMSIAINSDDAHIDLEYKTPEDYDGLGVFALKEDHLVISSLSPFTVKVNSTTTSPMSDDGVALNDDGATSGVTIRAERGTTKGIDGAITNLVTLSSKGEDIIDSNFPSVNNTFNITYTGEGQGAYRNKYFGDGDPVVYTTNVIYTINSK